ncbi:hypothetical protein SAY86_013851 [Trapa natans]|uniref:Uncharacterized protein n=1 Tax=Trapa natans TaxID=22666 RepID=A0AAN7KRX9_TRANT|nr:hypothetical protein SAY86_013851 [Trapa natans]
MDYKGEQEERETKESMAVGGERLGQGRQRGDVGGKIREVHETVVINFPFIQCHE